MNLLHRVVGSSAAFIAVAALAATAGIRFGESRCQHRLLELQIDLLLSTASEDSPPIQDKISASDIERLLSVWDELDLAYSTIQQQVLHREGLRWYQQGMPGFKVVFTGVFANALRSHGFTFEEYQRVKIASAMELRHRTQRGEMPILDDLLSTPAIEVYAEEVLGLHASSHPTELVESAALSALQEFLQRPRFDALRREEQICSHVVARIFTQRAKK